MTKLPKPAIETTAFSRDSSTQPYYTAEQMLQFRRDALEECVQVCYTVKEIVWDHSSPPSQYETTASQAIDCAQKIKELLK
jgi:hypothetical protein